MSTHIRPGDSNPDSSLGSSVSSESLSDRLFRHLPATVWTTDLRMALTFVQGALIRNLKLDPATIVGRTLPDLLLDGREDHPLIQAHITALGGHESTVRVEWGGNLYSARVAPLRDDAGAIVGCVGAQQLIGWLPDDDLTVRENEIRLQRIIDWNIAGIVFGDDQGRITDANDAFLQLTGYTREELEADNVSWPSLMPIEQHQRQVEALDEILTTGRCTPFESEIIRPDGRRVTVLIGAARLSARKREGVAFVIDLSPYARRENWARAELAAADAIAAAASFEAATEAVLKILCEDLEWLGAWLWSNEPAGPRPIALHGQSSFKHSALAALATEAAVSGQSTWSPDLRAMVVGIVMPNRSAGSIVLIDESADGPERSRVQTTRAIAARLARAIGLGRTAE